MKKLSFLIQIFKIHFIADFKNVQNGRSFIVKNLLIKNICDVVERYKNFQNLL